MHAVVPQKNSCQQRQGPEKHSLGGTKRGATSSLSCDVEEFVYLNGAAFFYFIVACCCCCCLEGQQTDIVTPGGLHPSRFDFPVLQGIYSATSESPACLKVRPGHC